MSCLPPCFEVVAPQHGIGMINSDDIAQLCAGISRHQDVDRTTRVSSQEEDALNGRIVRIGCYQFAFSDDVLHRIRWDAPLENTLNFMARETESATVHRLGSEDSCESFLPAVRLPRIARIAAP